MKICIYGASSNAIDKSFIDAGELLGKEIAQGNHSVVFGGGAAGLMGTVARGAYAENGEIWRKLSGGRSAVQKGKKNHSG